MHLDAKLTAKDATDANTLLIRRLRDLNPMEDVPDQDSAKSLGKKFRLYFAYSSNPGGLAPKYHKHCIFSGRRPGEASQRGRRGAAVLYIDGRGVPHPGTFFEKTISQVVAEAARTVRRAG